MTPNELIKRYGIKLSVEYMDGKLTPNGEFYIAGGVLAKETGDWKQIISEKEEIKAILLRELEEKQRAAIECYELEQGPHLLDAAMIDDRMPVYVLGRGIRFSDLTDDEKDTAYFSQRYLAEKYEKEVKRLRKELEKQHTQKVRAYVKSVRKSK